MDAPWPPGFPRVPDEAWTRQDLADLALQYDTVERHGWYRNLDPVVRAVADFLGEGAVLVDYSGGTGILIDRLLERVGDRALGIVDVDSSPKFLRVAFEKFRDEPRVAFRRIHYLKDAGRLQLLDEVLGDALVARGVDALTSTNAIHLYYDLPDTLRSWHRVLREGGRVFVNSGNILRDGGEWPEDRWIIDSTVHAVERAAREIVREDEAFAPYRNALEDEDALAAHDAYREKVFLPPRALSEYLRAFEDAGFHVRDVTHEPVEARTREWLDFLEVYHDAIVGWVGGSEKVEGTTPPPEAITDRHRLMERAIARVFNGRDAFEAEWTYVTCERRA